MAESRSTGVVKWFSRVKGYGFIQPDGGDKDVFVHYSAIVGEGYRNLDEGERVEFTVENSPKGPQAVQVVGLGAKAPRTTAPAPADTETEAEAEVQA